MSAISCLVWKIELNKHFLYNIYIQFLQDFYIKQLLPI